MTQETRWAIEAHMRLYGCGSIQWVPLAAYPTKEQADDALRFFVVAGDGDGLTDTNAEAIRVIQQDKRRGFWMEVDDEG